MVTGSYVETEAQQTVNAGTEAQRRQSLFFRSPRMSWRLPGAVQEKDTPGPETAYTNGTKE